MSLTFEDHREIDSLEGDLLALLSAVDQDDDDAGEWKGIVSKAEALTELHLRMSEEDRSCLELHPSVVVGISLAARQRVEKQST
jgi:hypothetical protein